MPKSVPPTHRTPNHPEAPDTGEAVAAIKNRQIGVRLQIIAALQRLGIPQRQWPDFVRKFHTSPGEQAGYTESIQPPPFQPPDFERLKESLQEWAKRADAGWQQHRDTFMRLWESWVTLGVDEEIPPMKSTRGAGRKGSRTNAAPDVRVEWAARRLAGDAWKEIAFKYSKKESQVKKAASEILKLAGWPPKVEPPKTLLVKTKP